MKYFKKHPECLALFIMILFIQLCIPNNLYAAVSKVSIIPSDWNQVDLGAANITDVNNVNTYYDGTYRSFMMNQLTQTIFSLVTPKFHYVYKQISGDATIIAKLADTNIDAGSGRAGILIRDTLAADKNLICLNTDGATSTLYLTAPDKYGYASATDYFRTSVGVINKYLILKRTGNMFSAYYADNPDNPAFWTKIGETTNAFSSTNYYVGLGVVSYKAGSKTTFRDVRVIQSEPQPDFIVGSPTFSIDDGGNLLTGGDNLSVALPVTPNPNKPGVTPPTLVMNIFDGTGKMVAYNSSHEILNGLMRISSLAVPSNVSGTCTAEVYLLDSLNGLHTLSDPFYYPPRPIPTPTRSPYMPLSQGKPATASSFTPGSDPERANNGDMTKTGWSANDASYPQWWKVDLGASYHISQVDGYWSAASGRVYKYKIEVSSDNVNYATVIDKTGNTTSGNSVDTFSADARYVRITVTACTWLGGYAGNSEFQVWEYPPPTPTQTLTPTPTSTPTSTPILLSQGKYAYSSTFQTGNEPACANDGNLTATPWVASSASFPQSWGVDLGANCNISEVKGYWGDVNNAYKYKIEVSTDYPPGTTSVAVDRTSNVALGNTDNTFTAFGRFVKITVTGVSGGGIAAANEFQVYGSQPIATPTPTQAPTPTPTPILTPIPTGAWTLLSQNKTVTASSFQTGGEPNLAIDGCLTISPWVAADLSYPQWWKVDLGASYYLTQVQGYWGNPTSRAYKYKIEASSDDVNYWTVIDKTGNTTLGYTVDNMLIAGRYVRITVTGCSVSGGYANCNEFQVYGNSSLTPTIMPGPTTTPIPTGTWTLLSQNKTVTASSFQTGVEPNRANDGSLTTQWTALTGNYPQWWKVDLGASYNVAQVQGYWANPTSRGYRYRIDVSSDDVNYTTVFDNTGNTTFGNTTDNFSATARYVKITMVGCTTAGGYASVYEFKVYGASP